MIPRFRGNWRLPMCLCCAVLGLALLYLSARNALGQIPPVASGSSLPTVQFVFANYYVAEDGDTATIYVDLSAASTQTVTVTYVTSDGTATSPQDYQGTGGVLTFNPGQTSANFPVIVFDAGFSQDLTVNLTLSNPTGATLGSPSTAVLTIVPPNATCP